jgi:diadenylate cyclase
VSVFRMWFQELGAAGVFDIAFMSLLVYLLLVWFKQTRSAFVLTGIVIVAGIYLLTRQFNMQMSAAVFEQFFAVILIALVVIFQEEIRHFFERVAVWSLNRRLRRVQAIRLSRAEVDILVRTSIDFAREKIGALIVLRGKNMIVRHLDGGVDLNGELSEPLLKSLFDPHSIGHDGAVIIDGNRVTQFGCHLPLSKDLKKVGKGGTRHTAALGLAEVSDALCLVVSEERGKISVAQNGNINEVADAEKLTAALETFYEEISPDRRRKPWQGLFTRNWREKIFAVAIALTLWFVLIHGSKVAYETFSVPVTFASLPQEWVIEDRGEKKVDVTLRGRRSAFYFLGKDEIKLFVNPELKKGIQRIHLSSTDLVFPKNVTLEDIEPRDFRIELRRKTEEELQAEKPPSAQELIGKIVEKTKEISPSEKTNEVLPDKKNEEVEP